MAAARSISAIRPAIRSNSPKPASGDFECARSTKRKIVVASHNAGKIAEIADLIGPFGFEARSAAEFGLPEPDETGTTFEENAYIKALPRRGPPACRRFRTIAACASMRWTARPASTPPTGPRPPDGTRDFAMAMEKVEKLLARRARRRRATAPAVSSRSSALPGRTAMRNISAARSKARSSGRRAATRLRLRSGVPARRLRAHIRRDERRGKARLEAGRRRGAVASRPRLREIRARRCWATHDATLPTRARLRRLRPLAVLRGQVPLLRLQQPCPPPAGRPGALCRRLRPRNGDDARRAPGRAR